jgi:hypothetical protein
MAGDCKLNLAIRRIERPLLSRYVKDLKTEGGPMMTTFRICVVQMKLN